MFTIKLDDAKRWFFDRPAVQAMMTKQAQRALSRAGAAIMRRASWSIRRRKRVSAPGTPPSSHTGLLSHGILFWFSNRYQTVHVGPQRLNAKQPEGVPGILEFGGIETAARDRIIPGASRGRTKSGKTRPTVIRKGQKLTYRPRPFMAPALEKIRPQIPAMWASSVEA